ncbi:MAG: lipoate--protein ligase family protein [Acidimicrobiales bacterium]|nr:lipoate--protein ligase family protein [Acidimicrobiales bacterium]MBO0894164.1 lipoate--protein ligase family protein [Acidimicrobiales bacterium]
MSAGSVRAWRVEERCGSPGELHAREAPAGRTVTVCRATDPAVVLGSAQPEADFDVRRATETGLSMVRRRSGGGAVLVEPGTLVWADVGLERGDPLWQEDVSVSFLWLGEAWAGALAALGVRGAVVHRGRLRPNRWSRALCFAGLGPGEVTVNGRKLVGLSQRRQRDRAWFATALYLGPTRVGLDEVVAGGSEARQSAARTLGQLSTDLIGVGVGRGEAEVASALAAHLPR